MSDPFSDDFFNQAIQESREARTARENLKSTIEETTIETENTRSSFMSAMEALQQEAIQNTKALEGTYKKMETAGRFPPKLRQLIGLFDDDFSTDSLRAEAAGHQVRLNAVERRRANLQQRYAQIIESQQRKLQTSTALADLEQKDFTTMIAVGKYGLDLKNAQHQKAIQDLKALSDEDLSRAEKGEITIPNVPLGLIQTEMLGRQSDRLGVEGKKLVNASAAFTLDLQRKQEFLSSRTPEELDAILKSPKDKRVFGVTDTEIVEAQQKLEQRNIAHESFKLAQQVGNKELMSKYKAMILRDTPASELQKMITETQQGKTAKLGDITFTATDLQAAFMQKKESGDKFRDSIAASKAQGDAAIATRVAFATKVNTVRELSGNQLPPSMEAEVAGLEATLDVFSKIGSPGGQMAAAKSAIDKVEKYKKDIIAGKSKNQKAGATEYYDNDGRIVSQGAASTYLYEDAANPSAMAGTFWDAAWGTFALEFQNVLEEEQNITIRPSEDGVPLQIEQPKKKELAQAALQKALKKSKFTSRVGNQMVGTLFEKILKEKVTSEAPDAFIWKQMLNEQGDLNEALMKPSQSGRPVFSLNNLNTYLSDVVNPRLRANGLLPENGRAQEFIIAELKANFPEFFAKSVLGQNSPTQAAMIRVAFGNERNIANAFEKVIQRFGRASQIAEANRQFITDVKNAPQNPANIRGGPLPTQLTGRIMEFLNPFSKPTPTEPADPATDVAPEINKHTGVRLPLQAFSKVLDE